MPGPMTLIPVAAGAADYAGSVSMQEHTVNPSGVKQVTKKQVKNESTGC